MGLPEFSPLLKLSGTLLYDASIFLCNTLTVNHEKSVEDRWIRRMRMEIDITTTEKRIKRQEESSPVPQTQD